MLAYNSFIQLTEIAFLDCTLDRRVKVKISLYRPLDFQEVEAPRFPDNLHMKMVRLSGFIPAAFTTQSIFLVLISARG